MSNPEEHYEVSRAALLAGKMTLETPPYDGGPRYGISAVLRPASAITEELECVRREIAEFTGPGQWWLEARSIHVTLRSLEPHSTRSFDSDARFAAYVAALDEAVSGFPPVELELRGFGPHPGGVVLYGHCGRGVLPGLRERYVDALDARGVVHHEANFVRDLWYCSLVQFASPVRDVTALLAWGEANRDRLVGTAVHYEVDIMRWRYRDGTMKAELLYTAKLDG
ncbi:MAG: 2'-5' RNA ligase family protein [Stackebrandtia sp.]